MAGGYEGYNRMDHPSAPGQNQHVTTQANQDVRLLPSAPRQAQHVSPQASQEVCPWPQPPCPQVAVPHQNSSPRMMEHNPDPSFEMPRPSTSAGENLLISTFFSRKKLAALPLPVFKLYQRTVSTRVARYLQELRTKEKRRQSAKRYRARQREMLAQYNRWKVEVPQLKDQLRACQSELVLLRAQQAALLEARERREAEARGMLNILKLTNGG